MTDIAALLPAVLFGYVLGSIPTAYLLVRLRRRVDIRRLGSGNVGALNTYEVTGSRGLGAAVLVLDLLKGVLAVWAGGTAAGAAAVAGHCYPVWLGFHGGRGLATAAGVVLVLAWSGVLLWGLLWAAGFRISREVNIANMGATLLTGAAVALGMPGVPSEGGVPAIILLILAVIVTRLVHPVVRAVRDRRNSDKES